MSGDIRRLLDMRVERDALRAENVRLRAALRKEVCGKWKCYLCQTQWPDKNEERHAPGCLAALEEGKT